MRRQQKFITHRLLWLEDQVPRAARPICNRERERLRRFARAGEYRGETTGNHGLRLAKYARLINEQLGLKALERDEMKLGAPMHDIGKIDIPNKYL